MIAAPDVGCLVCGQDTDGLLLCAGCCRDKHGRDLEAEAIEHAQLSRLAEALAEVFAPADTREAA
jgi:hypothetical protein